MHGDKVPAKDEKKLMEYDPKLYMMAKNAAAMLEMRKRKEHKSLWEDEKKQIIRKHLQMDQRLWM